MGIFDNIKDKADDLAEAHGDKIKDGIDKAADVAGEKAPDHADKIDSAAEKVKGVVDDLAQPDN